MSALPNRCIQFLQSFLLFPETGTCNDVINGYSCICDAGFTGKQCDENIDECESSPCFYGNFCKKVNQTVDSTFRFILVYFTMAKGFHIEDLSESYQPEFT